MPATFSEAFPRGTYYLVDQLNRAALSIVANIAEGNGRWHVKDRKSFFWIARGSTQECVAILEVCRRRELIALEIHEAFRDDLERIGKMIWENRCQPPVSFPILAGTPVNLTGQHCFRD